MAQLQSLSIRGKDILDIIYPVGSFYMSTDATAPSTLFGGTWERIKGAFIWGIADNETPSATGGEKTHTLIESELPKVDGTIATGVVGAHATNGVTGHAYGMNFGQKNPTWIAAEKQGADIQYGYGYRFGNNQPHNNMPPYYGAYIWHRTA